MKNPFEKPPTSGEAESQEAEDEEKHEAHYIRHSKALYQTYGKILASEDPQQGFDPEEQVSPDLTPEGIELAQKKAEEFFDELDPEKDVVFFVSSNEARALETANIYRQEAHKRGIEVTRPKKSGTKLAEEIGEGEIRAFSRLSIDSDNVLIDSLFTPSAYLEGINWEAVDVETREKWQEAKAVIDADDKGSFGANFLAHSEEMQGFFPEIKTAKNKYEREFKNLLRLLRFGMKKIEESEIQKRVHIVAFGHEDSMLEGLRINFGEESIGNCEMVTFGVEEGEIRGEFRGKEAVVE